MSDQPATSRRSWPIRAGCGAIVLLELAAIAVTVAIPVTRGRRRMEARRQLEQSGGAVDYAYQFTDAPPRSKWSVLADRLGMDVEPALHVAGPGAGWMEREIALLRYFPEAQAVDLGPSELSGPLLAQLRQMKNVRSLALWKQPATPQSLANLRYFPALTDLLIRAELHHDAWQGIAGLRDLESLGLIRCQVSAPAPAWFRSPACRVEQVSLQGDSLPGDANNSPVLHELRGWPSLRFLRASHVILDDAAVQTINSLPALELFELFESEVPASFSPAALTGPNLKNLTVASSEVHRQASEHCSSWTGPLKIELSSNTVVD